jgi:hypothetical protein
MTACPVPDSPPSFRLAAVASSPSSRLISVRRVGEIARGGAASAAARVGGGSGGADDDAGRSAADGGKSAEAGASMPPPPPAAPSAARSVAAMRALRDARTRRQRALAEVELASSTRQR